ncbi:WD repeat-containing protein 8 [Gymnopus androsaceus JB14]|uniref:WD repeat-containing protein 8 n=1 Tax=Gymnopus androsaceus JB14 TaxID=1447944 RepID=A0A6A4ICD2_9AGAR|nr:WD repeat-containing protein 8 [Gymnopus androsaceus JB14]
MDFTEIYKQTGSLVAFSPGTHFILTAVESRLIIRSSESFEIKRTWLLDPTPSGSTASLSKPKSVRVSSEHKNFAISHIGWSCDSEYILAACAKNGVVHVFKLRDEEWNARIDCGAEGLVKAIWAPDGRTILCFSEWGLRVTVWSLVTGASICIQYPLYPDRGYAFRADGRYFVLAERHRSKDTLGLYDASESYKLVRHFPLPTSSLASFALSPTGNHLAVWEGQLEYRLFIVTLAGVTLASFSPEPEPVLGIRQVAWHPSGHFLAVAGWDDKVHILDSLSWSPVITFELSSKISSEVAIWREPSLEAGRGFLSYERLRGPQTITLNKKAGASQLEWNQTGSLLLVRFGEYFSRTLRIILIHQKRLHHASLHIYSFPEGTRSDDTFSCPLQTIILSSQPILQAHWNPTRRGSLAFCCGNRRISTFSNEWEGESGEEEEMVESIAIPTEEFNTRDICWSADGKGFILMDKATFCCAFEVEE